MPEPASPLVRVEDATLVDDGGPARVVVSRLDQIDDVGDAVASAGGIVQVEDGRLRVTVIPSRLVDAAGRTGGADLAEPLRATLESALEAWVAPPPPLETPAGALPTSERTVVMGIVNVTPDSFSEGGAIFDPDDPAKAVAHAESLVRAGADLLDVGGESTRPGAEPVDEDEERRRVIPVVEALAGEGHVVSIDTTKAAIAREAVAAGAAVVNDVSAGLQDPEMLDTVADLGVAYVAMHRQGTPQTMQDDPTYHDLLAEIFEHLADRVAAAEQAGISRELLIVDPGIGFGKTAGHNLELLHRVRELRSLGRPVLVGASRKSFLGHVSGVQEAADRVAGSLGAAVAAVLGGAAMVRVHDVAETVEAVRVADAIRTA